MPSVAVENVLQKLDGVKPGSGGWVAKCPAHDDQHQSLKIDERDDGGVLLHCHAGCLKLDVLAAMGLQFKDLFAPPLPPQKRKIVKEYNYHALSGELVYQAVRYHPKDFAQRRPDGKGGWHWNLTTLKGKHVPYRLPELKGQNLVAIVEGEKDADRLWTIGIPATTNIGGATNWTANDSKSLTAAGVSQVVIIPDNDEAGLERVEKVMKLVAAQQIVVKTITLPGVGPHEDVSDWLNNGGSKDQLLALMAAAMTTATIVAEPEPDLHAQADALPQGVDPHDYHQQKDIGAAKWWRDRHQDFVRFDHQTKDWFVWDEHFWRPDGNEAATRLAMAHVDLMQQEALLEPDYMRRKLLLDFAVTRMRGGSMQSMMDLAKSLLPISLTGDTWDQNGWLLGCPNGVLNLQTGVLRPGRRDDLITMQTGVEFNSQATCPRWMQFLTEVFDGKTMVIDYIHKALGYSLTADMREQCFFVGFGAGANGKSIFLDTLESVFGTYAHRADMRMFAGFAKDVNTFHIASFRGKRMVFASEVRKGGRMNEHILKQFTGGETVSGEHKFGKLFAMRPVGKIWLGVNHRPKVADDSKGFWRRLRLIPFERTFDGSADDKKLRDELKAESVGILRWLVEGCARWQEHKLDPPVEVLQASDDYRTEEDPLIEFIEGRLDVVPEAHPLPFRNVYEVYRTWATGLGLSDSEKMSAKEFSQSMKAHGLATTKMPGGNKYYLGLKVVNTENDPKAKTTLYDYQDDD